MSDNDPAPYWPLYLTIRQAVDYTGLGRDAIVRRLHPGEWPSFREGKKWFVPRPFLDKLAAFDQAA